MPKQLTDEQVIRALRRLEAGWPDGRQLVAINGTLSYLANTDMSEALESDELSCFSIPCDGSNGF